MIPGISTLVRIRIQSLEEDEEAVYKSRVADTSKDHLLIELPIEENTGKMKVIPEGTELIIWYFGQDGSKYIFPSRVIGRTKDDIPGLMISIPRQDQIERVQRRNYLRVPFSVEVAMQSTSDETMRFVVKTVDISGGGMAFICSKEYQIKPGNSYKCWVALPFRKGMDYAPFIGQVVRVEAPQEADEHVWCSMMFNEIKELDRDKVVRFCFEKQLELHKKGVL